MTENNEKKRFSRRVGVGVGAIVLISIAFYYVIETFKMKAELLKLGMDLFGNYTSIVLAISAIIIGGLSATDLLGKKKA